MTEIKPDLAAVLAAREAREDRAAAMRERDAARAEAKWLRDELGAAWAAEELRTAQRDAAWAALHRLRAVNRGLTTACAEERRRAERAEASRDLWIRESRHEAEQLRAMRDHAMAARDDALAEVKGWHDTYQQHANDTDKFLGELLELLPGAQDEGMDAYDQIPRAIKRLGAELASARGTLSAIAVGVAHGDMSPETRAELQRLLDEEADQ